MLVQGYEQSDIVETSITNINSWPTTLATLVAITAPEEPPTDDEIDERLKKLQM